MKEKAFKDKQKKKLETEKVIDFRATVEKRKKRTRIKESPVYMDEEQRLKVYEEHEKLKMKAEEKATKRRVKEDKNA